VDAARVAVLATAQPFHLDPLNADMLSGTLDTWAEVAPRPADLTSVIDAATSSSSRE
jgi:hypothetical protein